MAANTLRARHPEEQTNSSSALRSCRRTQRPAQRNRRPGWLAIIDVGAVAGSGTAEIAAASISEGIMLRATAVVVCFSSPHVRACRNACMDDPGTNVRIGSGPCRDLFATEASVGAHHASRHPEAGGCTNEVSTFTY